MRKEVIKKYKEVFDAWLDGADIEMRPTDKKGTYWRTVISPTWESKDREYRVKPEPKECWIAMYGPDTGLARDNTFCYATLDQAMSANVNGYGVLPDGVTIHHMVEDNS